MRNRRTLIVLLLAIGCGLVAGYSALQLMERQPAPLQTAEPGSATQAVMARRDLPVGHLVGEEDVQMVDWPGDALPDGLSRSIADVVGRGLIQAVRMNEPLLESKLASRGTGGGLPIVVPEGMRALTVPVNDVVGVAGFIDQGTRVDVIVSMVPPGDGGGDPVTRIILQNIEVLARAQNIQKDPQGQALLVPVVTLSVTPDQAEQLAAATMNARIQLALRNMIDVKEVRTPGVRMTGLLTLQGGARLPVTRSAARVAVPQTPESRTTIEMFKGGKRALIQF
jgi:pilus assembly protein CpaB